jgi:hypothetical protein
MAFIELEPRTQVASLAATVNLPGMGIAKCKTVSAVVSWTGTPTGVIKIQVSNDPELSATATWVDLTVTLSTQPAGSAGNFAVDLTLGYRSIRFVYTKTSGTGSMTVAVIGKG